MPLQNEDRELQIRIAELQADVQIYPTVCFGMFTAFLTIMTTLQQIYFTLPSEKVLTKNIVFILMPLIGIVWLSAVGFLLKKSLYARKQIKELRKHFVW